MNRFTHARVLVTGAASGIGQATALRLLSEGALVAVADVSEEGLAETTRLAKESDLEGRLHSFTLDVADEASVVSGVRRILETLGGLDVLVNAAGILRGSHTHRTTLDMWNRTIAVNLTGMFLVTREALPALLGSNRGGVVVNFSSTSATFAHPYMAAYAASKGGIQSFTHALALEYGKQGLRAVAVAPGSIKSGITDTTATYLPSDTDWTLFEKLSPILGTDLESGGAPMAGPEKVAGVIAMLASEDGSFITGTEIRIDGGTHA